MERETSARRGGVRDTQKGLSQRGRIRAQQFNRDEEGKPGPGVGEDGERDGSGMRRNGRSERERESERAREGEGQGEGRGKESDGRVRAGLGWESAPCSSHFNQTHMGER